MDRAFTYYLKIYDTILAQFRYEKTLGGFRACDLEIDPATSHLLPLNIMQAPNDVELNRFLESRRIPKGRVYLEEVLRPFGLAPTDTKGIIDLTRGVSVNDAYSVVPAGDDMKWETYNLFENDFDAILQVIAYTGSIPEGVIGSGRPSDLTPSGTFPKTWRKIDGKLVLYKAGSVIAAPNYGKEPYAEALAWQVAQAGGFHAVPYDLAEWQGKVCSTCALFNTEAVSFVPFDLCVPIDLLQLYDIERALEYFGSIGEEAAQKFRSMAVFDSVIANTDRHVGNFGVMRENSTGRLVGIAPIFDNNVSLFTRYLDEQLQLGSILELCVGSPGMLDATLGVQGASLLEDIQRSQVDRLRDFEFDGSGFIAEYRDAHPEGKVLSEERLHVLSAFVRARAGRLLEG